MKDFMDFIFRRDKKRKIILINPEFQLKIIATIVSFFLFIVSIFYTVNWYFFYQLRQNGIKAGIPLESEYFTFIANSSRHFGIFFFSMAFLSVFIIYYFGLRLSHRIAGPIFKINKTIDEVLKNKKTILIHLREDDYFHDHADKINELLKSIEKSD
jgi:hypothetical protein